MPHLSEIPPGRRPRATCVLAMEPGFSEDRPFRMKHLRLIADDLAGALDTAAQFAGGGRKIRVYHGGALPADVSGSVGLDAATREATEQEAAATMARLSPMLAPDGGSLAYKKVDSWLRGHPGTELGTVLRAVTFDHCIIAPAFPAHGRITRGGRQYLLSEGARTPVGEDISAVLRAQGFPVTLRLPGEAVPEGISLWDAATDLELGMIAKAGRLLKGSLLWCGCGGLAAAVAGTKPAESFPLSRPLLGVIGSDHPVTGAQLEASSADVVRTSDGRTEIPRILARLRDAGACIVAFEVPRGASRPDAAVRIARAIDAVVRLVPRPASLVVSGGETARAVCLSTGADHLEVEGELSPGIPVSRVVGGIWHGVRLVSKSGAFGDEMLLLRLTALMS